MNRVEKQKKDLENKSKPYYEDENKSDFANDMASIQHYRKKKRSEKVLFFLENIQPSLESKNLKVTEFNTNSFRITDGIKQIDFYPASGKVFTNNKKWKQSKPPLLKFLINELT